MDKKKFYTTDIHWLQQVIKKQSFVDFLNESIDLISLIAEPIEQIKEKIWSIVQERKEVAFNDIILEDEEKINLCLAETLTTTPLFISITDETISAQLFSKVFNKLCGRLFHKDGHNNEEYIIQSYVHAWLENNLAKQIAQDEKFSSPAILIKLIDQTEMLHQFYGDLIKYIPSEWITSDVEEWIKMPENQTNILEHIRTFDKDYFKGYEQRLSDLNGKSLWKYIEEATRYSDYAMLNKEFSFKSSLLFEKSIPIWIQFWDNLKYPVLQDIPFIHRYPFDIIEIAKRLKESAIESKEKSHLACILLKNSFETSISATNYLSVYTDENVIKSFSEQDEAFINKGKKELNEWQERKQNYYNELFSMLSSILGISEIEEWVFSLKPRSTPQNKYTEQYNGEIQAVVNSFSTYINTHPQSDIVIAENFNLQKFNFLISQIQNGNNTSVEVILKHLINYIKSESFYWDQSYEAHYWDALKGIGILLGLVENPEKKALELICQFKVAYEGWNINHEKMYQQTSKETFILSGVILLFEHVETLNDKSELFFNQLLDIILTQYRFAIFEQDKAYQKPLYLLWLVVNQIQKNMKPYFEKEIIQNIDNLVTVFQILKSDSYQLEESSEDLLKNRIEKELPFVKRRNSHNREIRDFLEKIEPKLTSTNNRHIDIT